KPPVVSPLGLLCDPHLSHDKPMTDTPPNVLPEPVPVPPVDEEELNNALERRNKILEGEEKLPMQILCFSGKVCI
uniref:Uncharacterized protein n=2 Tax=Caenorhabditis japonica TaxID=281687 RepID=A0A8R1ITP8_CAEJA